MHQAARYGLSAAGGVAIAAVTAAIVPPIGDLFSPFLAVAVVYAALFNYTIEYWDFLNNVEIDRPLRVIGVFAAVAGFGAASLFRLDAIAGVLGLGIGLLGYTVGITMGQFAEDTADSPDTDAQRSPGSDDPPDERSQEGTTDGDRGGHAEGKSGGDSRPGQPLGDEDDQERTHDEQAKAQPGEESPR